MLYTNAPLFIVYFDLGIGGVQRKIVDLVNFHAQDGRLSQKTIYILLEQTPDASALKSLRNTHAHILVKPIARLPFWLYIAWQIYWKRPETILAFLVRPFLYTLKAMRLFPWFKIPVALGLDVVTSDAYKRGDFTKEENAIIHDEFGKASTIIVPSKNIQEDLVRVYHILSTRIFLSTNWTTIIPPNKRTINKKYDCIYIGRFAKEKNLSHMISLIEKVKHMRPRISLVLVGEGTERASLQRQIKNLRLEKNVTMLPATQRPNLILAQSKIALYTSVSEGSPLFLLEAMAHGLPIVSVYFYGVNDILSKKTGFVCTSDSEFIRSVMTLLTRTRVYGQISTHNAQLSQKVYSPKNIKGVLKQIYKQS